MWETVLWFWRHVMSRLSRDASWAVHEKEESKRDGDAGSETTDVSMLDFEPDEDVRKLTSEDLEGFSQRNARFPEVPPNE